MAEYYLISQLPSLDSCTVGMPPPISEEGFFELCKASLNERVLSVLESLTLTPARTAEPSGSRLVDKFNDGERKLRLALGKARAELMGKVFDTGDAEILPSVMQTAMAEAQRTSPMEAELALCSYRLALLEQIRPIDGFCEEYLYYFGLKLKLLWRICRFERELGEREYKKIYSSVLNGEELEA